MHERRNKTTIKNLPGICMCINWMSLTYIIYVYTLCKKKCKYRLIKDTCVN